MPYSRLDAIYRSILLSKYFVKGWGKPENLKRLFEFRKVVSNRDLCYNLVAKDYNITFVKDEEWQNCRVLEGHFLSPLDMHLPGLLPEESRYAHFQMLLPSPWPEEPHKPVCLHLAGTGDHYFWKRRTLMAKPLLKEAGIGAIILESPFYGLRKPNDQVRSTLHNVSDIFVMGGCLILESLVLFNWCESQGYGPLGVTGLSMGGHMASLAATNWPKPLVVVPCLSWSTASGVFTEGVMSAAIPWDVLENQYFSDDVYREEIRKMVTIIEDDAFEAGRQFAQSFPDSETGILEQAEALYPGNEEASEKRNGNGNKNKEKKSSVNALASTLVSMSTTISERKDSDDFQSEKAQLSKGILSSLVGSKFKLLRSPIKISEGQPEQIKGRLQEYQLRKDDKAEKSSESLDNGTPHKQAVGRKLPFSLLGMSSSNLRDREALQFMRGIMDECTHLKNFEVPFDTSLIIAICATEDGYVPREGVTHLTDIWPGAEVRYVKAGHVGAYLLHQTAFRKAIKDAFNRARQKYPRT